MTFFESDRQEFCSTAVLKALPFDSALPLHERITDAKLLGDDAACLGGY